MFRELDGKTNDHSIRLDTTTLLRDIHTVVLSFGSHCFNLVILFLPALVRVAKISFVYFTKIPKKNLI
jgi:hypothetical protein